MIFKKFQINQNAKTNRIWVEKGSTFYNRLMKSWLEKNDTEMYSVHNEGESVIAERFIRILKIKIYKYMTTISKNVYIDKLDDIVNKRNNKYHAAIKMKPVDIKSSTYINSRKEINDEYLKFKIDDIDRILKYKNISAKGYVPSQSEEVIFIKNVRTTVPQTYVISDFKGEEIAGMFFEKKTAKSKSKIVQT